MKKLKQIPLWAFILILLLLANLGWVSWNLYRNSVLHAAVAAEQFKVEVLHTNDVSPWPYLAGNPAAIGIMDVKTGHPVWAKWILDPNGGVDIENYYFQGKHVFDVYQTNNQAPVYDVYFRGPGKAVTWWHNRSGAATFTERTFYDTNGVLLRDQVWYNEAWHTVVVQNGSNGLVINGQWHQLAFDTNGMWTIEAP